MNMIYDTQRTVIDLRDQENGNYYDANELLDGSSEDQTIRIREGLQLAQRSRMYKYVCAICGQPLKLCNRVTNYKESWFFAHFANSEDCPIKTDSVYSPKSWTERWLSIFKESNLHKSILTSMYKLLSSNLYYVDVAMKKRISYPNITNEWRVPDIYANYNGKKIVFEFQLYTTFLNVIIDRNSFYRLVGIDIIWIFPYFTTSNQRMCEKDTYYSHNRNVFVFDTENYYNDGSDENKPYLPFDKSNYKFAQEESFKCGKLMLNCYWQEPRIENGKVQILWRHKLVSIDELTFDESNHDVYYIDSDKLFYDAADSQTKKIYDEWKEAKEKRWNKIYIDIRNREDLIRNQQLQAEKKKEQQLIYNQKYEIIKKVRSQELELQLFEKEGLWGYKCENIVIIEPKFCDAKLFCEGIAPVKTTVNGHWGACLFLNKVDTLKSTIMKKKEEQLQISLDRVKLQKHVYELCRVQKLTINEVRKKTGLGMGTIYRYLHTFEEENPKLVEQMKKQGPNIIPEDYKKLQEEVLRLKCELKRERLRADFYEEMVAFGKEVYGIDLKKAGTK